jgi:hypothetical protein
MKTVPWRACRYVVGILVILMAIYIGSYFAMIERGTHLGRPTIEYREQGSRLAAGFFEPIYVIDSRLRFGNDVAKWPVVIRDPESTEFDTDIEYGGRK